MGIASARASRGSGRALAATGLAVCLASGLAAGCASPVKVAPENPNQVQRELTANVLTTGELSPRTLQLVDRLALRDDFAKRPAETLVRLHQRLASDTDDLPLLAALAELSFYQGNRTRDPRYYFAASIYAYALLFPGPGAPVLDDSDPRVRLAYDLYNRGIVRGWSVRQGRPVNPRGGSADLPFGRVDFELANGPPVWGGHELTNLVSASDFRVEGLRNRYRQPGIGAPFSAKLGPPLGPEAPGDEHIPHRTRVPVTAFYRIEAPRRQLAAGRVRAEAEFHTPWDRRSVEIDGRAVPLEMEISSSLASELADSPIWSFELRGFFSGVFWPITRLATSAVTGSTVVEEETRNEGLFFVQPYQPGRVPVVLVHGTASSPGRWADLVNELLNDPFTLDHYQIWLFLYNTGNPIGYSGGRLRHALEDAVQELDPGGADPALRRMVVIGHSQGGLLTKLTAIDSGSRFWDNVARAPLDDFSFDAKTRELLRSSMFFTPEPFVKRVIFVCTPHRGSYLASFSLAGLLSSFVTLPSSMAQTLGELALGDNERLLTRRIDRLPTSIDNMTPGNPFIRTLAEIPVAPGIHAHSIIAVKGPGPPEGQSDGVVRYESAHIEGVDSELVVRSSHSAQAKPETIQEIRRILRLHVEEQ
jgi:pimeloyl-ACP methyl ester carboxylesterase